MAEYLQKNPPPAGRDGQPGTDGRPGRDAEVNYEAIISAVLNAMPRHTEPDLTAIIARIESLEAQKPAAGTVHVIVTDNGKEVFNRAGVPDGATVRVPITRVER